MEPIEFEIGNYRNFSPNQPLKFTLNEGISFILGKNNIGKSNLLKFFYDFRDLFQGLASVISQTNTRRFTITGAHCFDQYVNQNSSDKSIICNIKILSCIYKCQIYIPDSNKHSTELRIQVEISIPPEKNAAEKRIEIQDVFHKLHNCLYIGTLRSSGAQLNGKHKDCIIGSDFIKEWNERQSGQNPSLRREMDVMIDELKDLFGYRYLQITVTPDQKDLILRSEDGSFLLSDLGDGIGHFVIALGNALFKRPSFILIDEPENGLHPAMQEIFIRALASKAKNGLIASSHSIGLARSVADKLLSMRKNLNKTIDIVPYGNEYKPSIDQTINEMSYSQFVDIGGNNILLVEGRTDIKSYREILRKYGIENKFIILSFGGGELLTKDRGAIKTSLEEIKRLNAKSYSLIFDSEKADEADPVPPQRITLQEVAIECGFNVFITEKRATENYITQTAIDTLGISSVVLNPFEKFPSGSGWSKDKNWLLLEKMEREDFTGTKLEIFILEKLKPQAETL